jgi:hypothetical protein
MPLLNVYDVLLRVIIAGSARQAFAQRSRLRLVGRVFPQ